MNRPTENKFSPDAASECSSGLEDREPTTGAKGLPVWIIVLSVLVFFRGCLYLDEQAGEFNKVVYEPFASSNLVVLANPAQGGGAAVLALGKNKYEALCFACHQTTGLGMPGQFPPLAGSEWVNAPGLGRLIRIAIHGLSGPLKVKGQDWAASMPAMGPALTDAELAAVLSYIRQAWGNTGGMVKPDQVKAVRAATASRPESQAWTSDELLKIPDTE